MEKKTFQTSGDVVDKIIEPAKVEPCEPKALTYPDLMIIAADYRKSIPVADGFPTTLIVNLNRNGHHTHLNYHPLTDELAEQHLWNKAQQIEQLQQSNRLMWGVIRLYRRKSVWQRIKAVFTGNVG